MKYTPFIILFVAAMTIAACDSSEAEEEEEIDPTFTAVQAIFNTSCDNAGCHSGANPQSGVDLTQGNSYGEIVGVNSVQIPSMDLVDPGNPDNSYLVRKIEGDPSIVDDKMPPGRSLSSSQIRTIRGWISGGATNN